MTWFRSSLSLALLVGIALVTNRQSLAQEVIPGWHTNLDEARRLAESTGKPLFITFRCVR